MVEFMKGVDVDFIGNSQSGVQVDELRSMQTSAVYACVKILAETIASLPLHLYKKGKDGKNETADQHPLFRAFTRCRMKKRPRMSFGKR